MVSEDAQVEGARAAALELLSYCRERDWAGFDPYDILNSRFLELLPFLDHRLPRLALTQLMKRSPVNLRPLLRVPRAQNPKGIAIFLAALLKLSRLGIWEEPGLVGRMADKLAAFRSPGRRHRGWGYSFPWQTRTKIVPRGFPNLVCTVFVADALLDAYGRESVPEYLAMAVEAAEFILDELYWTDGRSAAGFGYPLASMRSQIHNANFLGAALLGRLHRLTGERRYVEPALRAARCSASRQNGDGSWFYGEWPTQRWVDNFHTGYNLMALRALDESLGRTEFDEAVRRGFAFYRDHFFRPDGAPRYFHDRDYPVDAHCVAQSLLTLAGLRDLDGRNMTTARGVLRWAMTHLRDERGFFYYQSHPFYTNKISYMRWCQAWMLLGLAGFLEACGTAAAPQPGGGGPAGER